MAVFDTFSMDCCRPWDSWDTRFLQFFGGKSRRNYGNPSVLQEDEQKTIEHMFPGLLQAELQTASMKPISN